MKNRFVLFSLSAVLALSFLPARAQRPAPRATPGGGNNPSPRTVTIEGYVRDANSEAPIEHVRVELRHFGSGKAGIAITGARGEFSFPESTGGDYQIVVEQDGYEPLQQPVQISDSMNATGIVLFLHRLEGPHPIAPAGTVSTRQLGLPPKVQEDFNQGLAELYDKHKPEASLPFFARVIAKAPKFYEAYHHSGVAAQKLGRNQEAETAFRKAIELSAGHFADSQITLASLLAGQGKFAEAETLARQGLVDAPGNWAANYELARALMGLHHADDAEKCIREALKARPDMPDAYLLLANIHMNRSDDASLIQDLDNFLRLAPKGPQSDKAREMREQSMKNLEQAKAAGAPSTPPK